MGAVIITASLLDRQWDNNMTASKIVAAAASSAGGGTTDVDEVFSTHLYDGTGSAQTITNGIDLSGEGGAVLTKRRDSTSGSGPWFNDTERGIAKYIETSSDGTETNNSSSLSATTSTGYTLGGSFSGWNNSAGKYVSWTFRKAKKFFDIVTYTGNATAGTTISHNLGSVPGMILVKNYSGATGNWRVYHRKINGGTNPEQYSMRLNQTTGDNGDGGSWNNTAPTATQFTLGNGSTNESGRNYVAYLFAHNNNDGGFGPSGDKDIIKCGQFTDSGSTSTPSDVNLGFEPQFILAKRRDGDSDWYLLDVMREMSYKDTFPLRANLTNAETNLSVGYFKPTPTGFQFRGDLLGTNKHLVYMAIRRGTLNVPEDATKVFKTVVPTVNKNDASADIPYWTSGFPVDTCMHRYNAGSNSVSHMLANRVIGGSNGINVAAGNTPTGKSMKLATDGTEGDSHNYGNALEFDRTNGIHTSIGYGAGNGSEDFVHMWRRAPGYHDVVAFTGTGSNRTVTHNLEAVPEMMWVKPRNITDHWHVYHSAIAATHYLTINNRTAPNDSDTVWNDTTPTSSVFTVGTNGGVNGNGNNYIAYLFASAEGVSKVGSFSHTNGSPTNVDCGFSNSARFIITKRTDSTSDWNIFNSERGIVAGNETFFYLNEAEAERSGEDLIDPLSSGFTVTGNYATGTYIFYAVA